ncbi:MAG: restriction endonuclease subunit S [Synechococcaceae cyanobacterium]
MSFPRYPAYKPSDVEWLGEVPEHWNRSALKYLRDYQNGYPFKPEDRGEEGLPIIRISQLTGNDEPAYYSGDLDERVKVRDGDLLFTWSATIDSFIWDKGEAWLNQHIFRVSPSAEADKRYLYYVIKHVAPKLADFDAHGSKMRHIKKESLGEKVYVPSVRDQGLIAAFLDRETAKIDALIAEQQRLIELLQEKRQAVISHAVTKGLNPDAPMKDSGVEWLGEVPEHWETTAVKHLARPGAKTFTDGDWIESPFITSEGVRLLQTGNVGIGVFKEQGYRYVSEDTFDALRCTAIEPNDVLICRLDGPVGRACLVPDLGVRMITSVDNAILKTADNVLPEYIVYLISSLPWLSWIDALCRVGGGFRLRVSRSQLGEIRVPLPQYEEQVALASMIKSGTATSNILSSQASLAISLLQERLSALIA